MSRFVHPFVEYFPNEIRRVLAVNSIQRLSPQRLSTQRLSPQLLSTLRLSNRKTSLQSSPITKDSVPFSFLRDVGVQLRHLGSAHCSGNMPREIKTALIGLHSYVSVAISTYLDAMSPLSADWRLTEEDENKYHRQEMYHVVCTQCSYARHTRYVYDISWTMKLKIKDDKSKHCCKHTSIRPFFTRPKRFAAWEICSKITHAHIAWRRDNAPRSIYIIILRKRSFLPVRGPSRLALSIERLVIRS